MKRKLPDHIPGTIRGWKQRKRQEMRDIREAFDVFRLGCAYTPGGDGFRNREDCHSEFPIVDLEEALKELQHRLSIKSWGR